MTNNSTVVDIYEAVSLEKNGGENKYLLTEMTEFCKNKGKRSFTEVLCSGWWDSFPWEYELTTVIWDMCAGTEQWNKWMGRDWEAGFSLLECKLIGKHWEEVRIIYVITY